MQCARGKCNHSVVKSSNEVSILMEMAAFLSAEVRRKKSQNVAQSLVVSHDIFKTDYIGKCIAINSHTGMNLFW